MRNKFISEDYARCQLCKLCVKWEVIAPLKESQHIFTVYTPSRILIAHQGPKNFPSSGMNLKWNGKNSCSNSLKVLLWWYVRRAETRNIWRGREGLHSAKICGPPNISGYFCLSNVIFILCHFRLSTKRTPVKTYFHYANERRVVCVKIILGLEWFIIFWMVCLSYRRLQYVLILC